MQPKASSCYSKSSPSSSATTASTAAAAAGGSGGGGATAAAAKAPMSLANEFGTLHMGSIADLIADDSMLDSGAFNRASASFGVVFVVLNN